MNLIKQLFGVRICGSCKRGKLVIYRTVGSAETSKCDNCGSEVTVYLNTETGKRSNE